MAKTRISEFDIDPANNTDINSINIAEGCAPSGINNAIRQLMSDLKEFQTGAGGDSITATGVYSDTIGEKTSAAGVTVDGVLLKDNGITASGTNVLSGTTIPSSKTLVVTTDIGSTVQAYDADTTKNDVANTFTANQIISVTDNSNAALRITQLGTGNALLVEDSSNPDSTPVAINADGRLIVGYTIASTNVNATTPISQIHSNVASAGWSSLTGFNWSNSTQGFGLNVAKSRSATIGSQTVVQSGDMIGGMQFFGDDGTNFIRAADIFAFVDGTPGTNDMPGRLVFSTAADGASSPTERMRIGSSGGVGIGGADGSNVTLYVRKNITGSTTSYGLYQNGVAQSDVTSNTYGFRNDAATAASAFTLANYYHFSAQQGTFGAGSTVTSQYGFHAGTNLTGATNNYGFYSNIASGTGRYNFYANGTADNYFAGTVGIGTSSPLAKLHLYKSNQGQLQLQCDDTGQVVISMGGITTPAKGGIVFSDNINAMWFNTASTERMRLDSSGNLGLGVTPSAWGSAYKALQFSNASFAASSSQPYMVTNAYNDNTNWIYQATNLASRYDQVNGLHRWFTAPSGTAGNAITFTQAMTLNASGNLALQGGTTTATGVGITFPATQSASTDANCLDDYEEGTFTPTVVGTTTAGTGTYTTQVGRYTKIGNRVFFNLKVVWSAHTGTGNIRFGGLPFTSNSTSGNAPDLAVNASNLTFSNQLSAYVVENTTQASLNTFATGAANASVAMDTSAAVSISGHYEV